MPTSQWSWPSRPQPRTGAGCYLAFEPPEIVSALVVIIIIIIVAARVALPAGRTLPATITAAVVVAWAAIGAILTAPLPDRVSKHLDTFHRRHRIVAFDHQLARPRAFLAGAILNDDRKTRARMQCRREWIVKQFPAPAHAHEVHAGHAQRAVTGITDRQGAVRATPRAHAAKRRRPGDRQLAGRRLAGDVDAGRARRIIARTRRGLGIAFKLL